MRIQLLLIIILILGACEKADEITLDIPLINLAESIKSIDADINIHDAELLLDNSIIIVGLAKERQRATIDSPFIARINQQGIIDTFLLLDYGFISNPRRLRMQITNENNIIITTRIRIINSENDIWISSTQNTEVRLLDKDFELKWEINFGSDNTDERGEAIFQLTDGDFIILSSFYNSLPNPIQYKLTRISVSGQIIWTKLINEETLSHSRSILYLPEDDSFLVLTDHSLVAFANPDQIKLTKFNTRGEKQTEISIDENFLPYTSGMKLLKDGNILAFYNPGSRDTGSDACTFVKLDSDLSIIWETSYDNSYNIRKSNVIECADESYLILSIGNFIEENNIDITISKINSEGDFQWRKVYGGENIDLGKKMLLKENSNILITGTTLPVNSFILEIDSEGNPIN